MQLVPNWSLVMQKAPHWNSVKHLGLCLDKHCHSA